MPLRLTDQQLAVAVALVEAPGHALLSRADAQAQLAALRHAGVVGPDGTPEPEAAATLRVLARALVRVELRRSVGEDVDELRAWADERDAVTGSVDGDTVELRRAPREALPPTLVRAAGLADSLELPEDDDRVSLPLAPAVLGEARAKVRAGDARGALEHLRAAGLDGPAADQAFAVAECLRRAFVAQGSWREPDGEWHADLVAGLDAGEAGWWSYRPGGDGPLEPTSAEALAARLLELLP